MPQPLLSLPEKPGVYIFKDDRGSILYVGKAINLRRRVKSYFKPLSLLGEMAVSIDHIIVESEFEALLLEAQFIKKYQPKYNSRLKDDKSPLYIKITEEKFPRVFPARKVDGGFGPYPKGSVVRSILQYLRRIFPFRSCKKLPSETCLYFNLGLCPGVCTNQEAESIKKYQKNILHLGDLLKGESQKVIKDLRREMRNASKEEDFEKAKSSRDHIFQLEYLVQKRHLTEEYIENPDLIYEIRQKELLELENLLEVKKVPEKIEGYDLSSLSGTKATGGMVVFVNGEQDKSFYRRFKIRTKKSLSDVDMIKEVILRRFKHPEWEFPDLIVVDGGKGQVAATMAVLESLDLKIPVIGLAKRLEEIIICGQTTGKWDVKRLPIDSPALNLLKRIRDESHRFARSYHLKLRSLSL